MRSKEVNGIRIHVYELRIGMCVCHLETLNEDSSSLFNKFLIKSQADIQAIQDICDYVYIDANWKKKIHGLIPAKKEQVTKYLSFSRSFGQAERAYRNANNLIKTTMDDVRFGNQLSVKAIKEVVLDCVDSIVKHPDAILLLTQLKKQDEYTAQHSFNVCVLSILLGCELKLTQDELVTIGICGLMHDIGKMNVPIEILNKPGCLTDGELEIMRKHAEYGRNILVATKNMCPEAIEVAHCHHEYLNGSGYPRGVGQAGLTLFSKIVAVVDAYDAITSDRVYQKGRSHLKALDMLLKNRGEKFDSGLVVKFVNCIGFYPQGNLVELSSGEIGVVVEQNKDDKLKPKVILIMDSNKKFVDEVLLDLSLNVFDAAGSIYKIVNIIRPQDYDVDLLRYFSYESFLKGYPVL